MDDSESVSQRLIEALQNQVDHLLHSKSELESLTAEVTDRQQAVTVRATAEGTIDHVALHAAARQFDAIRLGQFITETANQALLLAREKAERHATELYEAQRDLIDDLATRSPAAAEALRRLAPSPLPPAARRRGITDEEFEVRQRNGWLDRG